MSKRKDPKPIEKRSDEPTETIPETPAPLQDKPVLQRIVEWYDSLKQGEVYNLEEAAQFVGISTDEMKAQLLALRGTALPAVLSHISSKLED